jgi:hypothetical protein
LLLVVLKRAHLEAPIVKIKNGVDDVSFHAAGGEATVSGQVARAFNFVVADAQARKLPISWNKAGVLANTNKLASALMAELPPTAGCQPRVSS